MVIFCFVLGCVVPAFLISTGITRLMITIAPHCGLVDLPAERKVHVHPTPLGGGVGIYLGVLLTLALAHLMAWGFLQQLWPSDWLPTTFRPHLEGVIYRAPLMWGLLLGGGILVILGLIDDVYPISWKFRLATQFCVAMGIVAADIRATLFMDSYWIGNVLTVLWLVFLINSLNFLDNMDGLTGGLSLIAAVMFSIIMLTQTSEPRWLVAGLLLIVAGSCAGFLVWNWNPAQIFMGDAGSTFLGLMLGCLTVLGTFYDESMPDTHVMLAPLCVLAVPLYDFTSVMIIRFKRGLSPFHADKNHFSHRLVDLGLSRKKAVLTIYLCTVMTGLAGLLLYQVPGWGSAWTIIALVVCVLCVIGILETAGRRAARIRRKGLAAEIASQAIPLPSSASPESDSDSNL